MTADTARKTNRRGGRRLNNSTCERAAKTRIASATALTYVSVSHGERGKRCTLAVAGGVPVASERGDSEPDANPACRRSPGEVCQETLALASVSHGNPR